MASAVLWEVSHQHCDLAWTPIQVLELLLTQGSAPGLSSSSVLCPAQAQPLWPLRGAAAAGRTLSPSLPLAAAFNKSISGTHPTSERFSETNSRDSVMYSWPVTCFTHGEQINATGWQVTGHRPMAGHEELLGGLAVFFYKPQSGQLPAKIQNRKI